MNPTWYYMQNQLRIGPVSREQMLDLLGQGRLGPNDLVWQEGMADWAPARTLFSRAEVDQRVSPGQPPPRPGRDEGRSRRDDRRRREEEYDDGPEPPPGDLPPLPPKIFAAGIIWIIIGGMILLFNGIGLIIQVSNAQGGGLHGGGILSVAVCSGAFIAFIGGAFIFVGVQTIQGSAVDTLGNGIGSIIFAALYIGLAIYGFVATRNVLPLIVGGTASVFLIVPGILALTARPQYLEFRRARRPRSRRPRYD